MVEPLSTTRTLLAGFVNSFLATFLGKHVTSCLMTPTVRKIFIFAIALVSAHLLRPCDASALEKYGRPLPSLEDATSRGAEESFFAGYFLTSAFATNPTFAARPDNSGLVGLRHMLHLETDLYKQYLTFYTDQNFFSDR
ncbi:MAG: hypothetical protein HP496_13630, partial [Nitrospira sp.]|nr:hypothetical protein [Nitrospira sp.]